MSHDASGNPLALTITITKARMILQASSTTLTLYDSGVIGGTEYGVKPSGGGITFTLIDSENQFKQYVFSDGSET